jgi:hypothetical protein
MKILLGLLLLCSLQGCSFLHALKLAQPERFGLEQVTPALFVEAGADAAVREQLQRDIERARQAIRGAYGDAVAQPVVHACITERCYLSFGGSTSVAQARGERILLSPRGLDWHFIAHEWSHAEIQKRLGLLAWLRLPAWFDEGLAVAISEAPGHSEAHWEFLVASGVARPTPQQLRELKWRRDWLAALRRFGEPDNPQRKARGEPEIRPVYAAAGHELRPWLQQRREAGLLEFIARMKAGEDFDSAFAQVPP